MVSFVANMTLVLMMLHWKRSGLELIELLFNHLSEFHFGRLNSDAQKSSVCSFILDVFLTRHCQGTILKTINKINFFEYCVYP